MFHKKYRIARDVVFLMWICSLASSAIAADGSRIALIGFAGPLSEPLPHSAQLGAEIAVDEANQQHTNDQNPIRFELSPQNDRRDPNFSLLVARYFVKSKVSGVIGHMTSDSALAVADIYEAAGIPQLNFTSSSKLFTSLGYKSTFRVVGSTLNTGVFFAQAAFNVLHAQRVVVIGNDSAYSNALTEAFMSEGVRQSAKRLQRFSVSAKTFDFNAALKSAIDSEADLIFFSGNTYQLSAFVKSVKRLNIKTKILLNSGASNLDFSAEDNGNFYVLEANISREQCPRWKAFYKKFQIKYGQLPSTFSRYAYDATSMLIKAIRYADSTVAEKITVALHQIQYAGLSGEIVFDPAGNIVDPGYTLYHSEKKSWRPVQFFSFSKKDIGSCE